ncbi:MAG TPA: type II secretion system protein GspM [Solirubrobacteraceae bacterium]|jgi:Tfp pilus assembly protein PilO
MTARDRIVVLVIAALAVVAAVWLLAVAPEREKAAKLGGEVSTAQAQLAGAESQVAAARTAEASYPTAYASLVNLGKAVPTDQEVPSLIVQLAKASGEKQVEFSSITAGGGSASSSSATPAAASAGFTAMPFTFVFSGSFFDLYNLFQQLNRFTLRTSSGSLQVSGRLLTIQGVQLTPEAAASGAGKPSSGRLTGTITATAYVLPASSAAAGATATSPTGAQTTSGSAATSSATTPAVIGAGR